jgi:hypothetical protein
VTNNHGEADIWLVKTDSSGNLQWQKTYGGTEEDNLNNILSANGKYVFAGTVTSSDGDVQNAILGPDVWIVEVSSTGTILNQKCYGGTDWDYAWSIIQTDDNGYAIAGETYSNDNDVTGNHGEFDAWLLKLDQSLNLQWQICLGGSADDAIYDVIQVQSGDFYATGYTFSNDGDVSGLHAGGFEDFWTARLGTNAGVDEIGASNLFHVNPNPASDFVKIDADASVLNTTIMITDVSGKIVQEFVLRSGSQKISIQTLPAGYYFISLKSDRKSVIKQLIKI